LPRSLRAEGGKLHLGVEEGGQGISWGVRGVSKLLQLLLGLRLVIREDIALLTAGRAFFTPAWSASLILSLAREYRASTRLRSDDPDAPADTPNPSHAVDIW